MNTKIQPNSKSRIKNSKSSLSSICWLLEAGRWKLNLNQTNPIVNNLKHDNSLFYSWLLAAGRWKLKKTNPNYYAGKIFSRTFLQIFNFLMNLRECYGIIV